MANKITERFAKKWSNEHQEPQKKYVFYVSYFKDPFELFLGYTSTTTAHVVRPEYGDIASLYVLYCGELFSYQAETLKSYFYQALRGNYMEVTDSEVKEIINKSKAAFEKMLEDIDNDKNK